MMQTTRVFAAVVLLGVLGTLLFYAVSLVEYFAIPWHVSQRSGTGGHWLSQ
jgi:NitT/TauT family transport system permease protein